MKFTCLATGSKGNCYLLESNGRILVLDAGIKYDDVIRGAGYSPRKIDGVVVTHSHKDHSLSSNDFFLRGFTVWKPYMEDVMLRTKRIKNWHVSSFDVEHDGVPCAGFVIKADGRIILYATDFEVIRYDFSRLGITDMIIEANYTDEMLEADEYKYSHVLMGHACLTTTKAFIEKNGSDSLQNVILVHASAGLDRVRAIEEVKSVTKAKVFEATKGLEIKL